MRLCAGAVARAKTGRAVQGGKGFKHSVVGAPGCGFAAGFIRINFIQMAVLNGGQAGHAYIGSACEPV